MMHTDNGSEFSGMVTELLLDFPIKHAHGRPYHPQSQGMVEIFNKYIKKYLALSLLTEGNFDLPEQFS